MEVNGRIRPYHSVWYSISGKVPRASSVEIILLAYKAVCHILRVIYSSVGDGTISSSVSPPSEIVGVPIIPCLITAAPIALLSIPSFSGIILGMTSQVEFPTLDALILPVLDNLSQVLDSFFD